MKKLKILSAFLSIVLCLTAMPLTGLTSFAVESSYQVHNVYEGSIFYDNLRKVALTEDLRQNIIRVAMSQVGYHEGDLVSELHGGNEVGMKNYTEYGYWFGTQVKGNSYGHFYDWCAMFVSWCARQAQIPTNVISNSAYATASSGAYCFNNLSYRARGTYTPVAGDLIFFDWDGLTLLHRPDIFIPLMTA